jgi:uncharacterized protein (TIGR03905 family)
MAAKAKCFTYDAEGRGACCTKIRVVLFDGVIQEVEFLDGCPGNHQGIAALVRGRPAREVIKLLAGTPCGGNATSCPDQLAKALKAALGAK